MVDVMYRRMKQLRLLRLAIWVLLVVAANAFAEKSDDPSLIEYEKQISKFWSQAKQTDQQLIESGKQLATNSRMLEQQQKQLDKQAALLDRWERILERHEALLDAWERNEERIYNKAD